jgi:hypothetical protein
LADDYSDDGRAISQIMTSGGTPPAIAGDTSDYDALSAAYKQLDAPFGQFGRDSLQVSTKAAASSSPGDGVYQAWDSQLAACQALRTPLVSQINSMLNSAAFNPAFTIDPLVAQSLTAQANQLVTDMVQLNGAATPPNYNLCGGTPPNPTGPQGPQGPPGPAGPKGPAGPTGRRGPRGKTPKVTCKAKIHHGQVVSVTCKESGHRARHARAVIALSRGHNVVGWGQGQIGRPIALHHRLRLRGPYKLTVTVLGGPRTTLRLRF